MSYQPSSLLPHRRPLSANEIAAIAVAAVTAMARAKERAG